MDSKGPRPPTFVAGYPNLSPQKYMNIGYLKTPYPNKVGQGDYGPSQGGEVYYAPPNKYRIHGDWHNPWNPVAYLPLDFSKAVSRVAKIQGTYSDDIPLYLRK